MAEQRLLPSDLYGAGTLNTIELGGSGSEIITAVEPTNQYSYYFVGSDGQTDWNSVVTATSSPNADTSNQLFASFITGRGTNTYINSRIMGEFNLSGISGTITKIIATLTTSFVIYEPISVNLYDAGTTGLTGEGGEYSYYRDEGEIRFSETNELSPNDINIFTLNSSALTVANTKPHSFVIAAINSFDFDSTAPTPIDTIYGVGVSTIALRVFT